MNPTPHDIGIFIILEEERISISFLIGDYPNNWPLTQMTGLMEILGLEEYFKTKVTLSLTFRNFQKFLFRWNQWGMKIGENPSICQSNNLHLTSRNHWVLQLLKVANLMRCSIRQYQAVSNETLTGARGIDIFLLLKS